MITTSTVLHAEASSSREPDAGCVRGSLWTHRVPTARMIFSVACVALGICLIMPASAVAARRTAGVAAPVVAGTADVTIGSTTVTNGASFSLPVTIDVGTTVLGGYDITVGFDPAQIQFTAVLVGTRPDFSSPPSASQIDTSV